MLGQLVGNYRIVSELAVGGMGAVYVAEHKHMGKRAAIKLLLPELSKRQEVIARFFDEARAASHVDHPGIVQIFDCDYYGPTGQAYLVMELLQGETLRQRLAARNAPLAESWSVQTALAIAEPLAAAHDKGIVHRDLKPENVFLARAGGAGDGRQTHETVKVLDFGVAKLSASLRGSSNSTIEGSILGTPLYMSPEQCRGDRSLDARADIYSLGCVLFEMLCGRPPFMGETPTALIAAHLVQTAPDARSLVPSVSGEVAMLVRSMLAKDVERRPGNMAAVIDALAGRGTALPAGQASPAPYSTRPSAPTTGTQLLPSTADEAAAPRRGVAWTTPLQSTTLSQTASEKLGARASGSRRRGLVVAASVVAVAAAIVVLGLLAGGPGDQPAASSATAPATGEPSATAPAPARQPADLAPPAAAVPPSAPVAPVPPPASAEPEQQPARTLPPAPGADAGKRRDPGFRKQPRASRGGAAAGSNATAGAGPAKTVKPPAGPAERLPIE
jgi:eukaryotic-like serine/threonine-protein kinase